MVAILAVADGADGEDDMNVLPPLTENRDASAQVLGTVVYAQFLFLKQTGGPLFAVVDNLARFAQAVNVVGAQGEKCYSWAKVGAELQGVEYAGGVVHGAARIDHGVQPRCREVLSDAVGKAGAKEKHLVVGFYLERRLGNVYRSAECHNEGQRSRKKVRYARKWWEKSFAMSWKVANFAG